MSAEIVQATDKTASFNARALKSHSRSAKLAVAVVVWYWSTSAYWMSMGDLARKSTRTDRLLNAVLQVASGAILLLIPSFRDAWEAVRDMSPARKSVFLLIGALYFIGTALVLEAIPAANLLAAVNLRACEPLSTAILTFAWSRVCPSRLAMFGFLVAAAGVILTEVDPVYALSSRAAPLILFANFAYSARNVALDAQKRLDTDGRLPPLFLFGAASLAAGVCGLLFTLLMTIISDGHAPCFTRRPSVPAVVHFAVYNFASYWVLLEAGLLRHSLLVSGKRVFTAVAICAMLMKMPSATQCVAVATTLLGLFLFEMGKAGNAAPSKPSLASETAQEVGEKKSVCKVFVITIFALVAAGLVIVPRQQVATTLTEQQLATTLAGQQVATTLAGQQLATTLAGQLQSKGLETIAPIIPCPALSRRKRMIYVDPAAHYNLGDNFIASGAFKMLQGCSYDISVCCICQCNAAQDVIKSLKSEGILNIAQCSVEYFRKVIAGDGADTYVVFQGGGNWGDLYPSAQEARHDVAQWLALAAPEAAYISFPQSFYYSSKRALQEDVEQWELLPFGFRKNMIFLWRDHISLTLAKINYQSFDNRFVMDQALWIGPLDSAFQNDSFATPRFDVSFSLRSEESVSGFGANELAVKNFMLGQPGVRYELSNGWQNAVLGAALFGPDSFNARLRIGESWVLGSKVVVADKLHITILNILAGHKVVFVDNSYNKIANTLGASFGAIGLNFCSPLVVANVWQATDFTDGAKKALAMLRGELGENQNCTTGNENPGS